MRLYIDGTIKSNIGDMPITDQSTFLPADIMFHHPDDSEKQHGIQLSAEESECVKEDYGNGTFEWSCRWKGVKVYEVEDGKETELENISNVNTDNAAETLISMLKERGYKLDDMAAYVDNDCDIDIVVTDISLVSDGEFDLTPFIFDEPIEIIC